MTPAAAGPIVAACVLAALMSLAAAGAARDRERRLWLFVTAACALFALHKRLGLQAMVVGAVESLARGGGWYAERHAPQVAGGVAAALAAAGLGWWLLRGAGRVSAATGAALALGLFLIVYALLGLISLHAWDALVSGPAFGMPLYTIVEIVLPALIALCALVALAGTETERRDAAPRQVLVGAFLLGWMLLPVAAFVAPFDQMATPGGALPGSTPVTKAALLPLALLLVSLVVAQGPWRRWRPNVLDGAMALFCLTPLLHARPLDAAYLGAAWLATWLLGRVLLAGSQGRRDALALVAVTGLALLPIALLEGVTPAWLYGAVYGPHPFQTTGVERYIGYRPVGFFEDGNQYGIWIAMAAIAAVALARTARAWRWIAGLLVVVALASQSAGAILLLAVGGVAVIARPTVPRWLLPLAGAILLAGGGLYLSGAVPLDHLARDTRPGQMVLGAFRSMGRGSLPWRISQDQRALPLIAQHPLIGHGAWDWWRPLQRRPWGLPMLVIGQYGLLGLALLAATLLAGALSILWRGVRDERYALAVMVLLAGVDALLNSTIWFPAALFAGALAGGRRTPA